MTQRDPAGRFDGGSEWRRGAKPNELADVAYYDSEMTRLLDAHKVLGAKRRAIIARASMRAVRINRKQRSEHGGG